jgi:hypothetical protein
MINRTLKRLKDGRGMRVKTDSGLDVRVYNDGLDVELERQLFGVRLELVDARGVSGALAPPGAYFVIHFYEPTTTTEAATMMKGAIYLSREGVVITGCTQNNVEIKQAFIDYNEYRTGPKPFG